MEDNYEEIFEVVAIAIDRQQPIRFTLDNGNVYPHEEVIRMDGGLESFFFRISQQGAENEPDFGEKAGDIACVSFDSIVSAELLED